MNKEYVGNRNNDFDFITDDSLNWRVWKADNEKLILVADKLVEVGGYKNTGGLYLANYNGYNNCVKVLNEICKSCYSNKEYNAVSRCLNIEDIEDALDKTVWSPEQYSKETGEVYLGGKAYSTNKCYPFIYMLEDFSEIDDIKVNEGRRIRKK